MGVSVIFIEKGEMGGDCLNYGCVLLKVLIVVVKYVYVMIFGVEFGIVF